VARPAIQRHRKVRRLPVVIFGGEHGDLPLQANHGEAIAEIVGTSSTSCIIVTKHLSIRDRTKFFTDFAEAIMRKNKRAAAPHHRRGAPLRAEGLRR
jgi:hypothetical protein